MVLRKPHLDEFFEPSWFWYDIWATSLKKLHDFVIFVSEFEQRSGSQLIDFAGLILH
jgi:hypothetical protein